MGDPANGSGKRERRNAISRTATEVGVEHLTTTLLEWIENCGIAEPSVAMDISWHVTPYDGCCVSSRATGGRAPHCSLGHSLCTGRVHAAAAPPTTQRRHSSDQRLVCGRPTNATASTSLIVGLGYERDKASGACEYFDAGETWVFVPQSSIGDYESTVVKNSLY